MCMTETILLSFTSTFNTTKVSIFFELTKLFVLIKFKTSCMPRLTEGHTTNHHYEQERKSKLCYFSINKRSRYTPNR